MKIRIFLLLAIAFTGVIFMSSCVKNYTCQCSIVYSGYPGLPDSTTTSYDIKDSKSNAKSKCSAQSGTYNNTDNNGIQITTVEKCAIY